MCKQLHNKGKTPFCHLRKCCRAEGEQGGKSTGGQKEVDNRKENEKGNVE